MAEFERWLQSRLTSHGFPVGPVDGVVGPDTERALIAFQKSRGLESDGLAAAATIAALRATSAGTVPRPEGGPDQLVALRLNTWPRQADVLSYYGPVGASQVAVELPFDMFLAWDKGSRVKRITLHEKVAASAKLVLQEVAGIYSAADRKALGLDMFGGSLNVRKMRGGTAWSMHSWGIAIDFDPERNGLNVHAPQARLSHGDAIPFWQAWERQGWLSLGRAKNYDWMHVQAARL